MSKKFALLICNSTYSDPQLNDLVAPNNDVSSLANVLNDDKIGQFDKVDIAFLMNARRIRLRLLPNL